MARRWGDRAPADPFAVLGLGRGAGVAEVRAARRRLAKAAHPDAGGEAAEMQRINAAAEAALAVILGRGQPPGKTVRRPPGPTRAPAAPPESTHDHPSFTIEALPVEAFEGLLIVATWLGEPIDDDPPYRLEVLLSDPGPTWCRLELMPEAGATSVSLTVAQVPGERPPDLDRVRDAWVDNLNRLDWAWLERRPGAV